MKNYRVIMLTLLLLFSVLLYAQEYSNISESRKASIQSMLDYRYKGGFYTFEKDFNNFVEYPETAQVNCRMGICIASLVIDCEGKIVEITLKNPLKLGIDEQITNFLNSTAGKWNTCNDDRYTKFDVPIQFKIEGVKTNTDDAMLIHTAEAMPGVSCFDDQYYLEKAEKYIKKKKGKKALQYLGKLIRRNPYNVEYYEMQKQAISYQ
jgi:hypothetical protein